MIDKFTQDNTAEFLKDKMSEISWTVEDVLRSKDQANAVIGFTYSEKLTGTIQVVMLKDGRTWKIDTLTSPEITHLALW
jgi:hypothetical protein